MVKTGFSLNYAFVFLVILIGAFAVLFAAIPSDFFNNQEEFTGVIQDDPAVRSRFQALDLLLYESFGNDSMYAFEYSSIDDGPDPPDWETQVADRYLEVWWGYDPTAGFAETLEVRDTVKNNFLGLYEYFTWVDKATLSVEGVSYGEGFTYAELTADFNSETEIVIQAHGDFIDANIILKGNASETVAQSWYNRNLHYSINYEIDFEAMKPSAWTLIGQLLTFQAPDLGIPDPAGSIFSYLLGLGMWIVIAIIAFALVTSVIPTISGWVSG